MKAVPEGDGTLLDSTLVAYSNELALGWTHGVTRPPPTGSRGPRGASAAS